MITRAEAAQYLATVKIAYPTFKVEDMDAAVTMYCALFKDYTFEQMTKGLQRYIMTDTKGYAPSIGQIIDCMFVKNDELNEMSAWGLVRKAISNSAYNSESEFNRLPEVVQKAIGSPSQLYMWATDEEFNESVVQSNFMRSFRVCQERVREDRKLLPINEQKRIGEEQ